METSYLKIAVLVLAAMIAATPFDCSLALSTTATHEDWSSLTSTQDASETGTAVAYRCCSIKELRPTLRVRNMIMPCEQRYLEVIKKLRSILRVEKMAMPYKQYKMEIIKK